MANVVKVVCSDAEKEAWSSAAGFESLSSWCRRVLNGALEERGAAYGDRRPASLGSQRAEEETVLVPAVGQPRSSSSRCTMDTPAGIKCKFCGKVH